MERQSLIRTIYLYTFATLGLVLLVISGVRFLDMALKAFIFTKAEEEQRFLPLQPPAPYQLEKVEKLQTEEGLSEEEKIAVKQWLEDYKNWQEGEIKINYLVSNRHREASINLAMILIGLPLYFYHWITIKKELRGKKKMAGTAL